MRRDLLADLIVQNHRRFEVLHAIAAGVGHAGLHEELHDVQGGVVEVGEGVGAHLVHEVAFDDGVVDGGEVRGGLARGAMSQAQTGSAGARFEDAMHFRGAGLRRAGESHSSRRR